MRAFLVFILWAWIVFWTGYNVYEPIDKYLDEQTCITDAECLQAYGN